mmetsp:Transcript_17505/g.24355  ORF Transcript_17505/g.24355 Transcript_17505/m.24355 type:complete len:206 (+) Transcript_17505:65-682(+)
MAVRDSYGYVAVIQDDDLLVGSEKATEEIAKVVSLIAEEVPMKGSAKKGVFGNFQTLRFAYLAGEGFCFIIGADEQVQLRILMAYLEHIRKDFFTKYVHGGQKLNRGKYRKFMRTELEFFLTNKDADKLRGVLLEVEEVKEIMAKNLQKAVERGEKLETLQQNTRQLQKNAPELHKEAKKLKCAKCRQYYFCCFASCCACCDNSC